MRRLFLLISLAATAVAPSAAGARDVHNAGEGVWDEKARKQFEFKKDLSIGVEEGDDHEVFGRIADICVDGRGLVYIADFDQDRVEAFDATGAFVRTIGARGEGPGEFRQPGALAIDDADSLYVASTGRISLFDPDGTFVRSFTEITHFHVHSMKVNPQRDVFVTSYDDPTRKVIHKYHAGKHALSFCNALEETGSIDRMSLPTYAGGTIDLGPDGTTYYSQMTPYEIREFSSDGKLLVRIFRENDFVKPPRIEKHGSGATLYPFAGSFGIFLLPEGRLLNVVAIPGENGPGGTVLDLFDADGRLLTSQRLDWNFSPRCRDAQGRFYAADYRLFPAVVRYQATLR